MAGPALVVLTQNVDIARSVGRPGLLEARLRGVGSDATVVREPAGRTDVIAQRLRANGEVPNIDVSPGLDEWFMAHFTTSLSSASLAMAVVSLRDDLVGEAWRHRRDGFLVEPPRDLAGWTGDQQAWLDQNFERTPPPDAEASVESVLHVARSLADAAVLVAFNVSTYDPGGIRYDFREDGFAIRAHRVDLAMERVAAEAGIAIVDVDRSVAEFGGATAVEAAATYTEDASKVIAEDALTAINELGISALSLEADVMRIEVPSYDRRTATARIDAWHVGPGTDVERGAPMFDLTFDNLVHRLDYSAQETNRSMAVTVLAAESGRVTSVGVSPGTEVAVGETIAVVVKDDSVEPQPIERLGEGAPPFRVGIRVK